MLTGKGKLSATAAGSRSGSFTHPFYWAAFVLSGNWL
jgi:CHAT domain-containing protein